MENEKRLIDANALKARFKLRIDWLARDAHDEYTTGLFHGAETDVELIDEIPAVDAVEVVHGRWEHSESMGLSAKCSKCKGWVTKHSVNEPDFNYCPNCGAKMDGDAE